jgi:hypothetical protein
MGEVMVNRSSLGQRADALRNASRNFDGQTLSPIGGFSK